MFCQSPAKPNDIVGPKFYGHPILGLFNSFVLQNFLWLNHDLAQQLFKALIYTRYKVYFCGIQTNRGNFKNGKPRLYAYGTCWNFFYVWV